MTKTSNLDLFLTFLKIGAFTFGGGYAMLPLIKREIVDRKRWLSSEEVFDIVAIAESTPGPLAINAATFVGNRIGGVKSAILATAGVVLPSFVVISIVSGLLLRVEHLKIVKNAFLGIRTGVLLLIGCACITFFRELKKDFYTYAIMLLALFLSLFFKLNSIVILVLCACLGVVRLCIVGKKEIK